MGGEVEGQKEKRQREKDEAACIREVVTWSAGQNHTLELRVFPLYHGYIKSLKTRNKM